MVFGGDARFGGWVVIFFFLLLISHVGLLQTLGKLLGFCRRRGREVV